MIKCAPLGTAEQGECVCFRAHALRSLHPHLNLNIYSDDGSFNITEKMEWIELNNDGEDVYEFYLDTSDMRGLYWYTAGDGVHQLSVYDKNIAPPDWYGKGVTYHIFVDRFNRGSKEPLDSDPDFCVHHNTEDIPLYHNDDINSDIFGGDLEGVRQKLPYLKSLGVKTLYLSPIFEAWSNHKYNTADFSKIDSHFGNDEDLKKLCASAKRQGMRVILDGVFNHVGSDSIYFNREGRYDTVGAYQSCDSPYRSWFNFYNDTYESWWGILTLPQVRENEESYKAHIGEIASHWMDCGISGWRLDVADELPDEFIAHLYNVVKSKKEDALVIGEVWEDASNKIAYSVRRKYFTERELDGVMNYPIKEAILGFVSGWMSAENSANIMRTIAIHYPKKVLHSLMNHIGTHDTVRALTALARPDVGGMSRDAQAYFKLSEDEIKIGKTRLMRAATLQYSYPGSPTIYYGDEVGAQGGADPFNRGYYPWGKEDMELCEFYKKLGFLKNKSKAMQSGDFSVEVQDEALITERTDKKQRVIFCAANGAKKLYLKSDTELFDVLNNKKYRSHFGYVIVNVPNEGYLILSNDKKLICK